MAWDKVTKIDTIAKRKPYSKENQGVLVEYVKAYNSNAWANFVVPDTIAQRSVSIGKSGKMRRGTTHGSGMLVTNWASSTSTRGR